jgi:DNA-binding winged helix-turn-helix (wHTH) protein/tetratricopeptide (TPR) repeat protein
MRPAARCYAEGASQLMTMVASYRFGPFTVDAGSYRLLRGTEVIPLSPKIIDLLLYLVARQSALVPKDELFAALWPDVAVTDNALTQAVSELRQALGDDSSKPTYIQTVARRGYRFIAPVEATVPNQTPPEPSVETAVETKPPAIGVMDFTNVSTDREFAWLSSGIAETVTNDLRAAGTLRIIDRVLVVEAVRRSGVDLAALRADLHLDLAVVGSFQRSGDRLRITARVVDAASGEALAEAKADGALEQVFELQDRIVAQFAETLGTARAAAAHRAHRETSSLEAYQTFTEGRVRLESLDASLVPGAIADFQRAVVLDPRYALAHVGLGNARFFQYEMSRARNQPDAALLARAIDHVQRAIELERDLAEAHATYSFLLVSAGRFSDARSAARRAVALEPGYWGNQFRLAHAEWGEDRLRALARAMDLYPDFPFAHFEAAMVHIARGALDRAESVLREGTTVQDRQADLKQRYPAKGLHWLLGLVRLAQRDAKEARAEFEREIAVGPKQLYAAEFAMNAYDGAGFVSLETGDAADAVRMFRKALELFPEHARSLVGLGAALAAGGDKRAADTAFTHAATAIDALRQGSRGSEATLAEAFMHSLRGRHDEVISSLKRLVDRPELPFTGWTIPIEPLFAPLRQRADFQGVLATLGRHAR